MGRFVIRREPKVLEFLAGHRADYVRLVQLPRGLGIGVLKALVDKGLVSTAPATSFPRETGYMITEAGLRHFSQNWKAKLGLRWRSKCGRPLGPAVQMADPNRYRNPAIGVGIAVMGAAAAYGGSLLPPVPGQQVGPNVFPMVIGIGLVLCGIAIALGVGASFEEPEEVVASGDGSHAPAGGEAPVPHAALKTVVPPLLLLFYAFTVDHLGFIPTAAAMVAATCFALGGTWRSALILALCAPPAVHLVFAKLLRVPLPPGLLPMPW